MEYFWYINRRVDMIIRDSRVVKIFHYSHNLLGSTNRLFGKKIGIIDFVLFFQNGLN